MKMRGEERGKRDEGKVEVGEPWWPLQTTYEGQAPQTREVVRINFLAVVVVQLTLAERWNNQY